VPRGRIHPRAGPATLYGPRAWPSVEVFLPFFLFSLSMSGNPCFVRPLSFSRLARRFRSFLAVWRLCPFLLTVPHHCRCVDSLSYPSSLSDLLDLALHTSFPKNEFFSKAPARNRFFISANFYYPSGTATLCYVVFSFLPLMQLYCFCARY